MGIGRLRIDVSVFMPSRPGSHAREKGRVLPCGVACSLQVRVLPCGEAEHRYRAQGTPGSRRDPVP